MVATRLLAALAATGAALAGAGAGAAAAPPSTAPVDGSGTSTATSTIAPATADEPYPAGIVWEGPVEVLPARLGYPPAAVGGFITVEHVGDELWVLNRNGRGSVAARSTDGGLSWAEVPLPAPGDDENLNVEHVVAMPGGGYLAVADRGRRCHPGSDAGSYYELLCTRNRPLVFTSTDAATWTEAAPAAWDPPGDSSLVISSIIATDDGFLAAGTIQGEGWRAALFSSPDGVDWALERELTGAGHPLTAGTLVHDGTTLTFIASENGCGVPYDGPEAGWRLGSFWAHHGRIFVGADIASLTLQEPGGHPLAPEPLEPPADCGSVDGVPFAALPYPSFRAALVGGVTTIVELYVPPEQQALVEEAVEQAKADDTFDAEAVRTTAGSRRYAQLIDGAWVLTEIDGVSVPDSIRFTSGAGNGPVFFEITTPANSLQHVSTIIDGVQSQSTSHPVLAQPSTITAVGTGDHEALLLIGLDVDDPFTAYEAESMARLVAWRSTPGTGSTAPTCDLQPGGVCRFFDLTTHPGYPDFSGRDLAGVDLSYSNLGSANFDGANLFGARAVLATGERRDGPSFVGADLSWVQFQEAIVGDISGADVTGTNLYGARVERAAGVDFSAARVARARLNDVTDVVFGTADWSGATLYLGEVFPDLAAITHDGITLDFLQVRDTRIELDLTGADLTGVRISGPLRGEGEPPLLVITSLSGATIDGTRFGGVDLSGVDPAVDLGELTIRDNSICPDGAPPDGGFSGTCVREG